LAKVVVIVATYRRVVTLALLRFDNITYEYTNFNEEKPYLKGRYYNNNSKKKERMLILS